VSAQQTYPYQRPNYGPMNRPAVLSPYLNLLRGGNPAANYFLGTVPEVDRRVNQRLVNSAIGSLEREEGRPRVEGDDLLSPLPGTGHPTAFNTTTPYFASPTLRPGFAQQNAYMPQPRRR
jgi:hypothetical protein